MSRSSQPHRITMHETQGCLIVPIQEELSQGAAQSIQQQILNRIHEKPVHGVVIDLAGVQIIDSALWTIFINTTRMIEVMGVPSVLTGLNPGAVASIIDLQLDCDAIATAMHLEDAFKYSLKTNRLLLKQTQTPANSWKQTLPQQWAQY